MTRLTIAKWSLFMSVAALSVATVFVVLPDAKPAAPVTPPASASITPSTPRPPVPQPEPVYTTEVPPSATLLFVGDIMLDRGVRKTLAVEGNDYVWEQVSELLSNVHLRVGNLEGTVSERPSIATDNSTLRFSFLPAAVREVAKHLDVVSLANNHSMDFGNAGEAESHVWLAEIGLPWFGRWHTPKPRYDTDVNGIPLSIIGYHQFKPDESTLADEIRQAKEQGRFVIVFPHWGTEYQKTPDASQVRLAGIMIDAGADLIIGSHPHVVQNVDVMDGVPIIYSLGNFVFDQRIPETWTGLAVRLAIAEETFSVQLIPLSVKPPQPYVLQDDLAQLVLDAIAHRSAEPLREAINTGMLFFQRN